MRVVKELEPKIYVVFYYVDSYSNWQVEHLLATTEFEALRNLSDLVGPEVCEAYCIPLQDAIRFELKPTWQLAL